MKTKFLGSTMLAILGWQTASAVEVAWYRQPGSALHIASNTSASLWIVGTDRECRGGWRDGICQDPDNRGYNVYKWNGTGFVKQQSISARTLGVTTTDQLWVVNDQNEMFMPGELRLQTRARDIAVGPDNSVWIIGTDQRGGGYSVYQRKPESLVLPGLVQLDFTYADFAAVRIAVDKAGNAWVVNDTGEVYMYNIASQSWGKRGTKKARSVHTGASSGAVWMLGTDSIPGGFPIYQWDFAKQDWESYGTSGAVEMTEAAGTTWIVQSDGRLYSRIDPTTKPAPPDLTLTWPSPTRQQPWLRLSMRGTLLCADSATKPAACGTTQADWVGKHELNMKCDSGFYDPIWGGTCWKCPDDDGYGGWIRSLDAVDKDTACWRVPKEQLGYAIKVKAPALAWDCPSGSFWDGYSPDGCCGSCWKCPDSLPRRTANHITSSAACASSLNETSRAIFLKFNGCPKPDAATMKLTDKRAPGNPFLDVGAGGCYACPIVDNTGNFLIAERNANPLYGTSNSGCTINVQWKPAAFAEPGLASMEGVKDVIWEQKLFDAAHITGYLYDLAEARGLGDATPAAQEWVAARWLEIARSPYNNETIRGYIFVLLKAALKKKVEERTAGEKRLIESFAIYIRERRTYLAEQALAMYDNWKAWDDAYRAETGQSRQLGGLFYYGTVPYDFHGTLTGLMGLGGAGVSTISSLVAVNRWVASLETKIVDGTQVLRARSALHGIMNNPLRYLLMASGVRIVTGASLVSVAGLILSSVAIDQFVKIETARPKLQASLDLARQPVDLAALGEDMLYVYWSKAMDTADNEDPQVIQLAAMAQVRAEQSAYAAPPKAFTLTSNTDRLSSGTSGGFLNQDQQLVSNNGNYKAVMQGDGNFVIYRATTPIWATRTNGRGTPPYKLAMQTDGNLVVLTTSSAIWSTGARGGAAPFTLIMQDDGNLVVYDNSNRAIWASNTGRP